MTINRNLSILAGGVSSTGILGVPNGGSGATTLSGYLFGNGTSAFTASATIPTSALSGTVSLTSQVSGILPIANGGTGLTSLTAGLIPYGNGTSAFNNSTNLYFDGTSLGIGTGVVGLGNKLVIGAGNVQTDPGYGLLQKNTSYGFYPNDNVAGMKISTNGLLNIYTGGTGTTLTATFHASGGVSIGNTTDPGATNLSVTGSIASGKQTISVNGSTTAALTFVDTNTSGKSWAIGPEVGIGAVADFSFYCNTSATVTGYFTSAGAWYQGNNSAAWSITSDERIKENINTLNNGLSVITALRPVEFDYKISKKHDIGFIAQEYQKVLPEQINENEPTSETKEFIDDGKLLGISSNLMPYLVKAIQEQQVFITDLTTRLAALEGAKQ